MIHFDVPRRREPVLLCIYSNEKVFIAKIQSRPNIDTSAANRSIGSTTGCTITEKAPTRAFSWFTFKTLLRHYAKWALTFTFKTL